MAKMVFRNVRATGTKAEIPADTYAQTIYKTKKELQKLVNHTMYQLLTTNQGDGPWMDVIKDLEDKAHILI